MNRQRRVVITVTYNDLGTIIDTKAEELDLPTRKDVPDICVGTLISRQAAIDGADAIIARDTSGNNDVVQAMTAWKSYVEALPPAQPEQRWIPVSERLPEYGESVLCYHEDDDYSVNHIIDDEDGEWFNDGVVAWMPLPEPYEGGKDETD